MPWNACESGVMAWNRDNLAGMAFDAKTHDEVREAVAEGQWRLLYEMVPAMDGGQSYEMKCKICGEFGNIMASEFRHAQSCPVDIEERKSKQPGRK
jgi:hypothetical protein